MLQYLAGRTRKLSLPNGEEHKALYVIVDLDSLKASHNEITFSNTIGYPLTDDGYNINDRNYKDDIAAQRNVQKIAENIEPEKLIALSSTNAGTPIINKEGIVVSGNNRIMSLKLAVKQYPAQYEKYKQQLAADADVFGFGNVDIDKISFDKPFDYYIDKAKKIIDSGKAELEYIKNTSGPWKGAYSVTIQNTLDFPGIDWQERHTVGVVDEGKESAKNKLPRHLAEYLKKTAFKNYISHPVLVRIDESLGDTLTTEDLAKYNQDSKKGERPEDKAIKLAHILATNQPCRNAVLSIIDGYDTFSDLYSTEARPSRKKLVDNFVQCGLITEAQLPSYFHGTEFTDAGKDLVEMTLSALILSPDALKISNNDGIKRYRQIIIGSLPLLITNANLPDGASLKDNVSQALVLQYKINQVGDFADYMRGQSLFPEEKPDIKTLYLNSLLRTGRNVFKNAIRKYNDSVKSNSGNSLFGGDQTISVPEIFKLAIAAAADETDKKIIEQFAGKGNEKMPMPISIPQPAIMEKEQITNSEVEEIIEKAEAEQPETNWFIGDNFFKENPDKILGEAYEASGKWGKVTKYRGSIESVKRIDVSLDFIGNNKIENNPLLSVSNDMNVSGELMKPEIKDWVEKVVEKAVAQAGQKTMHKNKMAAIKAGGLEIVAMQTFEDVYRSYNPEIDREETEVFVWYKTNIGRPLSRQWVNLVAPGTYDEHPTHTATYHVDEEKITHWVKSGLLYYYEGKLIPKPIYLSGNMYDKQMQLKRDKNDIIEKYGQETYDQQATDFDAAWKIIYNKRLTINTTANGLVVLPISNLSNQFKINSINALGPGEKFLVFDNGYKGDYKTINWKSDTYYSDRPSEKKEVDSLTLTDAFCYWLLNTKPDLKEEVTHLEIVNHYCFQLKVDSIKAKSRDKNDIKDAEAKRAKVKGQAQVEGERLFKDFLNEQLLQEDKIRLETQWNSTYNNHLDVNLNKIPVAFDMCRYYKGAFEELKWEKREAVAFTLSNGSGCISYDVGVGKTPSAIFTIQAFKAAGYSKRPLLCVPNQVYKQFISEIKNFAPDLPILEGYNLSAEFLQNFYGPDGKIEMVPEGVITVVTYEALENIGFNENTQRDLLDILYDILNQGGESERATKKKESFRERIETIVGRGLSGTMVQIEDFGFDFICYDEAHAMKKVFTAVKGEMPQDEEGGTGKKERQANPYAISSGMPSTRALKGFMLNYYIQKNNGGGNVLLLTATPFTNSPLEIFSMLAMIALHRLKDTDLYNIKSFFDNYIKTTTALVINSRLKPQFKQVILGFNNLSSLQSLIRSVILYKTGEDVNVQRPNKLVIPYRAKIDDGIVLPKGTDKVESYVSMSPLQAEYMAQIIAYVEGKSTSITLADAMGGEEGKEGSEGQEIAMEQLDEKSKLGVRSLQGLSWARSLAISPYLYKNAGLDKPTFKQYIETSPKLKYVTDCIRSVKLYHESKKQPVSGQVIYMERGIEYFGLIKQYLIKVVGYQEHEIGIIVSGLPKDGKRSKEYVKNLFNGERYNESTKLYEAVSDDERIKVVIGSATIKEGINLQRYGTVLYNCSIDWNPTDIQQLDGRIWRQGNQWNWVRVVIPLVVDSADIFIFQKLQEKTSRLNNIWATDGKTNVLDTEDFNPEELKYALIRDPEVIAGLKSAEGVSKEQSNIMSYKRDIETIDKIKKEVAVFNNSFDKVLKSLKGYVRVVLPENRWEAGQHLAELAIQADNSGKDEQGRFTMSEDDKSRVQGYFETDEAYKKRMRKLDSGKISPLPPYDRGDVFDFIYAVRDIKRYIVEFVKQKDIVGFSINNPGALDKYLLTINAKIKASEEKIAYLNGDKFKKDVVDEENAKRKKNKLLYKTVEELVTDFSKLNYLLDDKKVNISAASKYKSCPPMDKDGNRLIDKDALKYLDDCIAKAGQTKDLYFDPVTNTYTPERAAEHKAIINELFANVKCVTKGEPIAVFTGGSPASGKTTYIRKIADYLLKPEVFHLDADEIRSKLKGYQGWNANATHKETGDIVNELLEKIGDGSCRYDFVYDGTMNKAQKYFLLINKVKALGYKTFIIFLDIPYAVARQRALKRYQKSGRYVPMEVIDDFFKVIPDHGGLTMGQHALNELKQIVDGYIVIDGITGAIIEKGGQPLPQERVYEGQAKIDLQRFNAGTKEKFDIEVNEKPLKPAEAFMPNEAVKAACEKYGWQSKQTKTGYELYNRLKKLVAIVKVKGDKYTIENTSGIKIMGGNKNVANAVETVIRDYFYGKLEAPKEPTPITIDENGQDLSGYINVLGVDIEVPVADAILELWNGGEKTVSSGYFNKWEKVSGLKPAWGIVFKGKVSKKVQKAAVASGMVLHERIEGKNVFITDMYLPGVGKTDYAEAKAAFDLFANEYALLENQPTHSPIDELEEIRNAITGLQLLADDGDTEAQDAINGLKILLS